MRNVSGMGLFLAVAVFGVSAVVFGATAVDAVRTEDHSVRQEATASKVGEPAVETVSPELDAEPVDTPVPVVYAGGTSYPRVSNDELLAAVNQDLFQPDRTPPLERYLFPSERMAPARDSRNERRRREPSLRIVGTAIAGDRALAMVQPEDSSPFAVLLGEAVDGYVLTAITEEFVTLVGNDEEFIYPVVEPDQVPSHNRNRNDRNARDRAANEDLARQLSERAQQILQGLQRGQMMRGGGGQVPQRIEMQGVPIVTDANMRTLLRARGGGSGGGGGSGSGIGDQP